ncbi:MAG: NAD(P)/FAD-dependent oxidoreductase [Chloroflexi bacterium]|nr:NAD(P)/FAD-dependent oxidoreductase [Chloroflexota bacterium]
MTDKADITIIGAGVVGLAVSAETARRGREIYVLEKNDAFGQETSSRNSEVIHAGIYYPEGTLKARLCVEGNRLLYELCEKYGIPFATLGKLIVAAGDEELGELDHLLKQGRKNGAQGLRMLSRRELKEMEPNVEGAAAILSPSTGVIDSHALMRCYVSKATEGGAKIAYRSRVTVIEKLSDGYRVTVEDTEGVSSFETSVLINCAGLYCDKIAALAGIDIDMAGYRLRYCKGEYFSVDGGKSRMVKRLIFPVPPPGIAGVGIHVTFDISGRMRLGPSIEYVDGINYAVDSRHKPLFYDSVKSFLPFIEYDDLQPEMAGIRPKLQGPGEPVKDFVIRDESDKGLPGLINLIGIESPGLTASPAIARYVREIVKGLLGK